MATFRKRGKKWQVQVRRKGLPPLSRSFAQKTDAQTWARQMEAAADRHGLPPDPKALRRLTVRQIVERYRDTVVVNKRGREVETCILNAFLRHRAARTPLSEIGAANFAAYRDERMGKVKAVTVRRELALLQHAFDTAMKEWDLPLSVNPLVAVKKPEPGMARDRRLHDGELERLIENARRCRNSLMAPVVRFAIETGMRRGEILNMRWPHLDTASRTLRIPDTKTGHSRTIPLSSAALEVLDGVRGRHPERAFPTTASALQQSWKRLTRRAAIVGLHFHDLRHEAVSRFFEKGLSVAEVALISGHRDYRQLFRYTHLRAEDVARKLA